MTTPTLSLSLLVLVGAACPVQAFRYAGPARLAAAVTGVAGLAWYVAPSTGVLARPHGWWWCLAAVAVGAGAIGVEVGVVAALRRRRVARVALHGSASRAVAAAVVTGLAEEVLFRGVAQHLLGVLGLPAVAAIGAVAVAYGLNHLYFGWDTVAQKVATGLLFGGLYALSGGSVLVPVIAHVTQNVLVLTVLPRLGGRP
ncbi:hypothetical protein Lfu02_08180 [Longispora fulva]|uniref:Membrane protease YdiL (CAAX protease family) n=1 Tax=Longispora fulva TaxID=619741 RepID=A0A8J7KES6_9ACTN|nr:CPBP family intramembrane glutamic endopeptidase [Longispora fulva]MBG6135315.1 membrane protease YdiL (CAAX protease family) [Longispora fulva]GIG56446.1 hypothetical protein Lfu02_08180 [Longispora fulva]